MVKKILFLASNPTATGRLRLDKEVREIGEGLKRSNERSQFDLIPSFAVKVDGLRRGLLDHAPRIVHFSGHSGIDGIVLEDEQGQPSQVPSEALANLFKLCAKETHCVILNACYSDSQAEAISEHIPYVIGMRAAISDEAAIEFAVGFYDALGAGKSVEDAFEFGRNAIALRNLPEDLSPVLKKKSLTPAERQRLEASYSPASDVYLDISSIGENNSSWNQGENTVLVYSADRDEHRIRIEAKMGYLSSFNGGGPIAPLNYLSQSWCAFKWDFPTLDFKVLNNKQSPLFLTEVVFDIEQSQLDLAPLLTIKKDSQQRYAGNLLLVNEGSCDLVDLALSFQLIPGNIAAPVKVATPFKHSIPLPALSDNVEVDVTGAFREEGVDIDGLILLCNGNWDHDTYVVPKPDGSEERLTEAEVEERQKSCLGRFQDEVGTLAGEISFKPAASADREYRVKFQAPVYLSNKGRCGVTKPPSFSYDTAFDAQNQNYQRRVQISHTLQHGEADRFTIKIAVPKSSSHRFRATIRDISGLELHSLPIEMTCFVPRSRWNRVESSIAKPKTE